MDKNDNEILTDFKRLQEIQQQDSKPRAIENSNFPLTLIDDRRFEELTYWLYKTEIKHGSWKGLYDDIFLRSGVNDKGIDCALYRNKALIASIQCKHSAKDTALALHGLVPELIKFALYYLKNPNSINILSEYTYYISSSAGFDQACNDFINDYNKQILVFPKFEHYTKQVMNEYASFKGMEFSKVEFPLKEFLSKLIVKKIDKEELNLLLQHPYQLPTTKAFFSLRTIIDTAALLPFQESWDKFSNKINEKTDTTIDSTDTLEAFRTASYHLLNSNSFIDKEETIHIDRKQVNEILIWVDSPLEIDAQPIALLVGDAGMGKTVVLKDVCKKLIDRNIPTLGIKSDKVYSHTIEGLEKELDFRASLFEMIKSLQSENEIIVIIIDQIDALSQSLSSDRKYLSAYNLLLQKLLKYEGIRVIISVRRFDLNYDPDLSFIKKNKTITLGILDEQEVKDILKKLNIPFGNFSIRLLQTLGTPHHLQVFCSIYNSSLSLDGIQELQDLYDELWKQKVIQIPITTNVSCDECRNLLYNVAREMNTQQQIVVKKKFVEANINSVQYLASVNILISDKENIQFFHQTFYDYVYARQFVENGNSILEYVKANSHSLHIRSSVKMILTYLRATDEAEYIKSINYLLRAKNVQFHLKLLVINIIGYIQNPLKEEKQLAKNYLLPNVEMRRYLIESVFGKIWMEFLIENKILDELLLIEKNWKDEILESKIIKKVGIGKFLKYQNYEDRRIDNLNQVFFLINRVLPSGRVVTVKYLLELPKSKGIIWLVSRTLYSLVIWDFPEAYKLFDKYKKDISSDIYYFPHILEAIIHYNIDFVTQEYILFVEGIIKNSKHTGTKIKLDYHYTQLFERMAEVNPNKSFAAGLTIIKTISDSYIRTIKTYESELYDDLAFWDYNYKKGKQHNEDSIYGVVVDLVEKFSINNDINFLNFIDNHRNNNSISILKIIVYGFIANPSSYLSEIVAFIQIFNSKDGFKSEGRIQFWIRSLLGQVYPLLSQSQKDIINSVILNITSDWEISIINNEEGKISHRLNNFGYIKYKYIKALPESEIFNQIKLKKVYQELKRKFPSITSDKEPMVISFMSVKAPLPQKAYQNMTFEQWEDTFEKYKSDGHFSSGGILEHSRSFCEYVKQQPDKFFPFVEKLIEENKVKSDYWIKGLEGLKAGNYPPEEVLKIYKKAIVNETNRENTLYLIWLSDYFIKNKLIDEQIFGYLEKLALNFGDSDLKLNSNDPITDGINSVRGAAIDKICQCNYTQEFKERILTCSEKIALDKAIPVKAVLLLYLAYLIKFDKDRILRIFIRIMDSNDETLIKSGIHSLQYLVNHDFDKLKPLISKWIKYEPVQQDLGSILTWCWIKGYKDSKALLLKLHKISETSRASSINIAYENLFNSDKNISEKCSCIFKMFLNDTSKEVIHQYDIMFLHIEEKAFSFSNWLPFLRLYAKSNAAKMNPHYFLDFILKYTGKYPKECIQLISNYKSYSKPDISNGPYYREEPVKIVLNCYNTFNNMGEQELAKNTLRLFNEMLKIDYFRKEANGALLMVEQ